MQKKLPPTKFLDQCDTLAEQKAVLDTELQGVADNIKRANSRFSELREELTDFGPERGSEPITTALKFVQRARTATEALKSNTITRQKAVKKLNMLRPRLLPWNGEWETLLSVKPPVRESVERAIRNVDEIDVEIIKQQNEIKKSKAAIRHNTNKRNNLEASQTAVTYEELLSLRTQRDQHWVAIKGRVVGGTKNADEERMSALSDETLAETFESLSQKADSKADTRFDHAAEAAEAKTLNDAITEEEELVKQLEGDLSDLKSKRKDQVKSWLSLWSATAITPREPMTEMKDWRDTFDQAVDMLEEMNDADFNIDEAQTEVETCTKELKAALQKCSEADDDLERLALDTLLDKAEATKSAAATHNAKRESLINGIKVVESDVSEAVDNENRCKLKIKEWSKRWSANIGQVGLRPEDDFEQNRGRIAILRDAAKLIHEIKGIKRSRIDTMNRDIKQFNDAISQMLKELAPDLVGDDAIKAIQKLKSRSETQVRDKEEFDRLTQEISDTVFKKRKCETDRAEALAALAPLFEIAKTKDIDELNKKIDLFERVQEKRATLRECTEDLAQQGDGKPEAELRDECRDLDVDEISAQLSFAKTELNELRSKKDKLITERSEAKAELDQITAGDEAAIAENSRQQALTEMRDSVEQYARLTAETVILRWAIEKYRKEKQAPMLVRASDLFRSLTLDEYGFLEVQYNEHDQPQLFACRNSTQYVGVSGLSDGTRDQLYLALRVAAIEDVLAKATPLPFVADDLFINFDDERAKAGLEILQQLSKKTQVLFFTHHNHLAEMAQKHCSVKPITL